MDTDFKNKLIEIFFEKFLIALLILLFGYQINGALERFKLIETQRVSDTSEFVKACSEIWAKIYDYEAFLDETDSYKNLRFIFDHNEQLKKISAKEVKEKNAVLEHKQQEILKIIREKKYIIGDDLSAHFVLYLGFLKTRSDAQETSRSQDSAEIKKNAQEVVELLTTRLQAMRFTASSAREHAINKLPD